MSLDWDDNSGKQLRKIRLEHNLNKTDFCKKFSLSLAKLERIELGFEKPNDKIITFMYKTEAQKNSSRKIEENKAKVKSHLTKKDPKKDNIIETLAKEVVADTDISKVIEEKLSIVDMIKRDKPININDIYTILDKERKEAITIEHLINEVVQEEEWRFVPKNRTQLVCGINIPENVVDYLEEAIKLNKFKHIYELRKLNEDALTAVRADMDILLPQKKEILDIPYGEWGAILDHCVNNNLNWFCYGIMLKMATYNTDCTFDIEGIYGGVIMSAKSIFNREKKECIDNIASLLNFIHNYSKKHDTDNKYIKYNDKDIFQLLKDISDKKEVIYFNIYKEKNGNKDCFLKLHWIEEGYIVELNNESKSYKYFYNSLNE